MYNPKLEILGCDRGSLQTTSGNKTEKLEMASFGGSTLLLTK
jgi:hypothetical protein